MIRKTFRTALKLGLLAAAAAAVVKVVQSRQGPAVVPTPSTTGTKPLWPPVEPTPAAPSPASHATSEPEPEPESEPTTEPAADSEPEPAPLPARAPGVPASAVRPLKAVRKPRPDAGTQRWVEPQGDVCPTTHPVKAKMASKIFHVVGGASYERTHPDRCYPTPEDAESDGLRASKR